MSGQISVSVSSQLTESKEWIERRNALLEVAGTIPKVDTAEQLDNASATYTAIGKHIRELDKRRKEITAPIDALKKEIMGQEKTMVADLKAEHARLKIANDAYATAQARKAEEKRRAIEAAEQQAKMAAAEAEMKARNAEAAAREVFGEAATVEPEAQPDPVEVFEQLPKVEEPAKLTGGRMRKRWDFEVINVRMIPPEYLIVDEKKIRAAIAYAEKMDSEPVIPGVKFESRMSVEGR